MTSDHIFARKRWSLALCTLAGYMNLTGVLLCSVPVSHHTGNTTQVVLALSEKNLPKAAFLLGVLLSYLLGTALSGYFSLKFSEENRYSSTLLLIGAALVPANLLSRGPLALLLATVLGIQNAMNIYYRGAKIRTTHITGYLTDIGYELGQCISLGKKRTDRSRFFSLSILTFMGGCALAYFLKTTWEEWLLPLASLGYFVVGILLRD